MKRKIFILIFVFTFLFSNNFYSVPSIEGISGTIDNGEAIVITGTDFGANGPTVHIFDDFELGTNNNPLLTGENSAQFGQWDSVDDSIAVPDFSSDYSVSGTLSYHAEQTHYSMGLTTLFPGNGVSKIFVSYWAYIPVAEAIPSNWKMFWFQGDGISDDDVVFTTLIGLSGGIMNGNETGWSEYSHIGFAVGTWKRIWAYFEGTTDATGVIKTWALNPTVTKTIDVSNAYIFAADSTPDTNYNFERAVLNALANEPPTVNIYMDDVYISTGDYAQARIEITNNLTYANSTNITVCTPTSWENTSVGCVLRSGSFDFTDETPEYLFVIDSDGVASAGYEINGIGASILGTVTESKDESDMRTAGLTLVIDITGDTLNAFDNTIRANILAGLNSSVSATGTNWASLIEGNENSWGNTGVVRTDDNTITITFPDFDGDPNTNYDNAQAEVITVIIPASALVGGEAITATGTFTIGYDAPGASVGSGSIGMSIGQGSIGVVVGN